MGKTKIQRKVRDSTSQQPMAETLSRVRDREKEGRGR
jgi:hypothetical protein